MSLVVGSGHTLSDGLVITSGTLTVIRDSDSITVPEAAGDSLSERIRVPDGGATLARLTVRTVNGVSTSAAGTYTTACSKEIDGGTTTNVLSTATEDLETLTDQTDTDLTLTGTPADLDFADGDYLLATIASNNSDLTGGAGVVVSAVWTVDAGGGAAGPRDWREDYRMIWTSAATQALSGSATFTDDLGVLRTRQASSLPTSYTLDIGANGLRAVMTRDGTFRQLNWWALLDDLLQAQGGPAYVVGDLVRHVSRLAVSSWNTNDDSFGVNWFPGGAIGTRPEMLARGYRAGSTDKFENSMVDEGSFEFERLGTPTSEFWIMQELTRFGHQALFATSEPATLSDKSLYSDQSATNDGYRSANIDNGSSTNVVPSLSATILNLFQIGSGSGTFTVDLKESYAFRFR